MPRPRPSGFTLVEAAIAMGLLLIGAVGFIGLANQGNRMNGEGRRVTRATGIAQDLVANIQVWQYGDARLANSVPANDADIGDGALAFESTAAPPADHAEADLTAGGAAWLGIPQADLLTGQYQRFWNVSEGDDWNANGVPDMKRIAVIVRWPEGAAWRRIVLFTSKVNPADTQ